MKTTNKPKRAAAIACGTTDINTNRKLTYFKVHLIARFSGILLCDEAPEEGLSELFNELQPLGTPQSWRIGIHFDRPAAREIFAGIDVYAVIPQDEAGRLSDARVAQQVESAAREVFRRRVKPSDSEEVTQMLEGFRDVTVGNVERATGPGTVASAALALTTGMPMKREARRK